MGDILIITGGPVCESFCSQYISSGDWEVIIAADRGLELCHACGLIPDVILGDFDSVDPEIFAEYESRFPDRIRRYPSKKDETDTELALEEAFTHPPNRIHILGALGGRTDHMLANIQLLLRAVKHKKRCFLADRGCRLFLTDQPVTVRKENQVGEWISLLAYGQDVEGLTLRGFAYETDHIRLAADGSRGISNYLIKEEGSICFERGLLLVIEAAESQ